MANDKQLTIGEAMKGEKALPPPPETPRFNLAKRTKMNLLVAFYAMHLLTQEQLAHYRYKAEVQDQQIRGLNQLGTDIDKYLYDREALLARLYGDVEARVGQPNKINNNWIYGIIAFIGFITLIAFFSIHPEVITNAEDQFGAYAIPLTIVLGFVLIGGLLIYWQTRRRGKKAVG